MKKTLLVLALFALGSALSATQLKQLPEEGEKIKLEKPTDPEGGPRSLEAELSAYYYADSETMVVTCQGYGYATVSICNQTLQILDTDIIDPAVSPVACLATPSSPGQYYIFIITSSFTAYGTFAVE